VTSEVDPFAKTGGLADVSAALPRHLSRAGHDVRVFVPFYSRVAERGAPGLATVDFIRDVEVWLGPHRYAFSLVTAPLPGSDAPVYFVHCPPLYARPAIYTADPDEHRRFLLLCRAALDSAQRMGFAPDIVHCNDWQSGMLPLMLKVNYGWDRLFAGTKTVLTIHNLMYQGTFSADILAETGLAGAANLLHQEQLRAGRIGFLLTGLLYADVLTTVSPTYAREIQTPEHGAGLHEFLRARADHLVGILNGVDDAWDPATDLLIPFRYSATDLAPKEGNKRALLEAMGLHYTPGVPAIGIVSRLASQKGLDLALEVLPDVLARWKARLVVLGSGERRLEEGFAALQRALPGKVGFFNGFQPKLAHLVEAGADIFLMPSRYEPCGLNQMYSLRYGTVPVVRKTGGLADTVAPYDPRTGEGTGFVFEHFDQAGLRWALEAALKTYDDKTRWRRLQHNGMAEDFSWDAQGRRYEALYAALCGLGPARAPAQRE
ncbi:MAG TPA: glycogen synthase, partial [Myxococcota bacterium]|nr:glycogen synthase [Myxococcota bacterium]